MRPHQILKVHRWRCRRRTRPFGNTATRDPFSHFDSGYSRISQDFIYNRLLALAGRMQANPLREAHWTKVP